MPGRTERGADGQGGEAARSRSHQPRRWGEIPEVPTTAQAGVAGYQVSSWIGALAPVATPAPVVERLSDEQVQIAHSPAFKDFCAQQSMSLHRASIVDDMRGWISDGYCSTRPTPSQPSASFRARPMRVPQAGVGGATLRV
ncbi:MAG: tripartite tricarboxylate transporter substrate-binding protein [Cupriavidus necator]